MTNGPLASARRTEVSLDFFVTSFFLAFTPPPPVTNSEVGYLGYQSSEAYGISYKVCTGSGLPNQRSNEFTNRYIIRMSRVILCFVVVVRSDRRPFVFNSEHNQRE